MGFEVDVERKVEGGEGSSDVELRKGGKRFCFEVSVNTPSEHDVAIIGKRLSAGYDAIVAVCPESTRLSALKAAALAAFDAGKAERLRFCMPDDLMQTLVEFSALSAGCGGISHGRKTNVNFTALSKEEAQKRREAIAKVSAQSLRRLKRQGG